MNRITWKRFVGLFFWVERIEKELREMNKYILSILPPSQNLERKQEKYNKNIIKKFNIITFHPYFLNNFLQGFQRNTQKIE